MTEVADPVEEPPKKKSKMPLILGLVLAIAGGGGGFMAVKMGLIGGDGPAETEEAMETSATPLPPMAFVALDPLIVSLPDPARRRYLRFGAQLEVRPEYLAEVEAVKPRIVDVLNGYLRAVEMKELEDPTSLMRLRGQMLRRVQVVAGEGRIRDILIMEFVID